MKFKITILIIIFVLIISGLGSYFYLKNLHIPIIKDNFEIVADIASEEERSLWLNYNIDTVGYSLSYPEDIEFSSIGDRGYVTSFRTKDSAPGGVSFTVFYDESPNTLDDYELFIDEVRRRRLDKTFYRISKKPRVSAHETFFAGKPAIIFEGNEGEYDMHTIICVWHDNKILTIEIYTFPQNDILLSKIFSTFQFLD